MRLHEIEIGVVDIEKTKLFYETVLGLSAAVNQPGLKVFNNIRAVDFNISNHHPTSTIAISFITDDLAAFVQKLLQLEIPFTGPRPTHLGMQCVQLSDPDGHTVIVNEVLL